MSHLCVAIFFRDPASARRDIALAAENGADMVELRLDDCTDAESFADVIRGSTLPIIATCRPAWEGGQSTLDDSGRADILRHAAAAGASIIDIELKSTSRSALPDAEGESRPRLILSTHDFGGRPARLYNLLADLNASAGDIAKLVWTARTVRDNLEAFEILRNRQKPTIALCMGEAGFISRILAKKFGGFLSFAALDNTGGTAPGQISLADMKRLYRWDAINLATRVYGVVGSPVAHSMSPAIHNAAFDRVGFDGVYVPLLVNPGYESFKAFMESFLAMDTLHLSGLSITIPHKENALRYLQERHADIDPLAARIGAINTIVMQRKAGGISLRGFSTDYPAILDTITSALGIERDELRGMDVAVLGAGGTGRTAVAALAHCGAAVTIFNRTIDRAEALASEFNSAASPVRAASMSELTARRFSVCINCTSVGMHPLVDASPFDAGAPLLDSGTLVFDTIYNPLRTRLLETSQAAGAKTVSGIEMFIRQAVGQFEAWTKLPAPADVMRSILLDRLGDNVRR